jgi:DNA-binding MarR family transcriptional regulator
LSDDTVEQLYRRPGFLIRRAHQIAVSIFMEETGELGITNRQYGILVLLKRQDGGDRGIDQITVAKLLGLDRSTTGMVLTKLEQDGLVTRYVGDHDRRRLRLKLTRAGERMLARLAEPARRAEARVLSVFAAAERAEFLRLLEKFNRAFNDSTRVPLLGSLAPEAQQAPTSRTRSRPAHDRQIRGNQSRKT